MCRILYTIKRSHESTNTPPYKPERHRPWSCPPRALVQMCVYVCVGRVGRGRMQNGRGRINHKASYHIDNSTSRRDPRDVIITGMPNTYLGLTMLHLIHTLGCSYMLKCSLIISNCQSRTLKSRKVR